MEDLDNTEIIEEEDDDIDEIEEMEILRNRRVRCSCDEDPDYCEIHNIWG